MNLLFVLPSIHNLLTGGNVYNRRIIEALEWSKSVQVHVVQVTSDSREKKALRNPEEVDVVIVDSLLAGLFQDLVAPGTPCILLTHYLNICNPSTAEADRRRAERALLGAYDGYITTSHYTKNCLIKAGVEQTRVQVAYPGLDATYRAFENPPAQSMDTCRMLTVASLLPGKGLSEHLQILSQLAGLRWTWDIVGEGGLDPGYRDHFLDEVAASPVASRITWRGPQSEIEMPDLYREYDLFVLPSHFETLGMVIREAMASGLPIVAYDVGGIAESIGSGTGILVHPYHRPQMVETLAQLIASPEHRAELGVRALQQSHYFHSWQETASMFLKGVRVLTK